MDIGSIRFSSSISVFKKKLEDIKAILHKFPIQEQIHKKYLANNMVHGKIRREIKNPQMFKTDPEAFSSAIYFSP
jgi:hypothetical protein